MKTVCKYLLFICCWLLLLVAYVQYVPAPADDAASEAVATELPETCGIPQDFDQAASALEKWNNEDIEDPPLSWHEAHCAPPWYYPPDHLLPDKWHPAQTLKNLKP